MEIWDAYLPDGTLAGCDLGTRGRFYRPLVLDN